jgi:hypothetical protein
MELADFIAGTLSEIMRGVSKAAKAHDSVALGGSIAPVPDSLRRNYASLPIREVEFDVAITVEKTSGKSKSGGVNIKVIEADLTSNTLQKTVGESRVKFSVPVCLPSTSLTDQ